MGYRTLKDCVVDLERTGQLVRLEDEVDPDQEAAEIHRRVFRSGGPAVLYANVKGCRFPMVSNLFGTAERTRFLFRDTWARVRRLIELKADPSTALRRPWRQLGLLPLIRAMRPRRARRLPVLATPLRIADLPQLVSWPRDGGPFITLPLVYTEDPADPRFDSGNLGMYRVQLAGNDYALGEEVGLHYQIHRGIGVHHARAAALGKPLPVNVFVGGTPAMILAAVMPLPEGMNELMFAGALSGRSIRLRRGAGELPIYADADFMISGKVAADRVAPEGPFGDHLGYYSLVHPFPVLRVDRVTCRPDAIWPFTVVGRPPQEDSMLGRVIHELTEPVIPSVVPGVAGVHAVDAAGVHPLLLAVGSERYTPYTKLEQPEELLTQANAILGQGQMSLAKYLWIADRHDEPPALTDVAGFLQHILARFDPARDLHFQTKTTIDTLDYSGPALNRGSKLVIAAVGPARRVLISQLSPSWKPPAPLGRPRLIMPGVVALSAPALASWGRREVAEWMKRRSTDDFPPHTALVVLVDDSDFAAASLDNFLWVTFTRSDPARDVLGPAAVVEEKHWGCALPLVIDARLKERHPPVLEPDGEVVSRVDAMAARGGPLARYL